MTRRAGKAESSRSTSSARERTNGVLTSEEQARSFIASVDEMVYFQGLDGSLSMLNDANARITGYSLEEFAANPQIWREIVHPDDQRVAEAFFARYPEGTESMEVEYRLRTKAGDWRWIQSRMVGVRDSTGKYTGYNCIDRDITEQKRIEQELMEHRDHLDRLVAERTLELTRAIREAESANRAKSRFLANLSHEVRTPMNAVLGLTSLLLEEDVGLEQREHILLIRNSAKSLLGVLDDILDLARIEAGRLELHPDDFDLRTGIRDLFELHRPRAGRRRLEMSYRIADDLPRMLHGDFGRLRQILGTLLGNAVKFTPEGSVELEVRREPRPVESEATFWIRFAVRDTGIGIKAKTRDSLFEPFTQEDS